MANPATSASFRALLKEHGLKDTQSRRAVLQALQRLQKPASPYDIQRWIHTKGGTINTVTVYRIIEAFERIGLVHRHPCDGHLSLCSIPEKKGHHGFLHCTSCGTTQEFHDEALCKAEERIARALKFRSSTHVSEILGICAACAA